jgi:hypothetical protein
LKKTVYEKYHDSLTGKLVSLRVKDGEYGKQWVFGFQDTKDVYLLDDEDEEKMPMALCIICGRLKWSGTNLGTGVRPTLGLGVVVSGLSVAVPSGRAERTCPHDGGPGAGFPRRGRLPSLLDGPKGRPE